MTKRTIIYIDGYNLYYSRLKNTPFKWLTGTAHWVRHYIRDDELAVSQLPRNVPTKKKPASKPAHW